jgi:GDPmannose 4,6-dehydratase
MKTALITGVRGQDGAYLSRLLLKKGYRVYGSDVPAADPWRLRELGIAGSVQEIQLDLSSLPAIVRVLKKIKPDEIYNFAAQSFVQDSFSDPLRAAENGFAVARLLEAVRLARPSSRFFQASTAELFGGAGQTLKAEEAGFHPRSPYSVAKLYAHWLTVNYRETFGLHAGCGILFNHESPLRGERFLTRKISMAAARIKAGLQKKVQVGSLDSRRDWGYAEEYVDAAWRMLQRPRAADYMLATGKVSTVRAFITAAFGAAGIQLAWKGHGLRERGLDKRTGKTLVEVSRGFYRPVETISLRGNCAKARRELGWRPATGMKALAALMVRADIERLKEKR